MPNIGQNINNVKTAKKVVLKFAYSDIFNTSKQASKQASKQ